MEEVAAGTERKPFQFSLRTMLILIAIVAVVLGTLANAFRNVRDAAFTSVCDGRLCGLALALHSYHDSYGTFPPAAVTGPDGRPWHSWRTLILPFIEQREMYAEYRFDEPWNGPSNQQLSSITLNAFRCDVDVGPSTNTSFVAITGPGTMWHGIRGTSLSEVPDERRDSTILIVEVTDSEINWMEPRDLRIDELDFRINGAKGNSISSRHFKGAVVAFADGHRELLSPETTAVEIRRMLLITNEENPEEAAE